jgi:endonuclease YncB( thermonuclease family)
MKSLLTALLGSTLVAGPIHPIDGDTVFANGRVYRLVGFDTPESGDRAQCPSERALAARATARLKQLLESGNSRLEQMPCSCKPSTEGTSSCNWGRLCATLTVDGRNVGEILINEELAHRYVCGATSCPRRESWC